MSEGHHKKKITNESINMRFKRFLNSLTWEDYVFVGIVLLLLCIQLVLFLPMQHLAGPIYGGDFYRERGFVQYQLNGGKFWEDPYFMGEYMFYPFLGYTVVAFIVRIFGVSLDTVMMFFPMVATLIACIGWYVLSKKILRNKTFALFPPVLYITLGIFVNYKPGFSFGMFFILMFLYYYMKTFEENKFSDKLIGGIFLGLVCLSHYTIVIGTFLIVASTFFSELIYSFGKKKFWTFLVDYFKQHFIMFLIALGISMLFFYPIIFIYHFKTLNPTQEYSLFDPDKFGLGWVLKTAVSYFWNTRNFAAFTLGLVGIAGFVVTIIRRNILHYRMILAWYIGLVLGGAHYLVTRPLIDWWIMPGHVAQFLFIPSMLFIALGIQVISVNLKKYRKYVIIFASLLCLFLIYFSAKGYYTDRWSVYGRQMDTGTQFMLESGDIMKNISTQNDVFLGNDESSFAIAALTGRYVVFVRRTHASPYVDVDKRYADGLVMMYGNNSVLQQNLLEKYNVSFFYLDQFLVSSPIIVNLKYKGYFEENGVNFSIQNVRLDPSTVDAPSYESLVVNPQNLTIIAFAKNYVDLKINNQVGARLYSFK